MDHLRKPRRGWLAVVALVALLAVVGTLISSLQWVNRSFPGFFLYGNMTVAPYFLPQWSGNQEGLRFPDRLVAVQGREVTRPTALYGLARTSPPGTALQYTVEREGKLVHLTISSMKFSFRDWFLNCGVYLLTGLGFLFIGFTPFYMRSPAPAAPALFFMAGAIFFWLIATFDFITAELLPKELRVFALTLTPSAAIHLGLALTRGHGGLRRGRGYLYLAYGCSIVLGSFYSFTFHGPLELWRWTLRLGYGYNFFAVIVFLALLGKSLRRPASDLERSRLRVVLLGVLLGFFPPTLGTVLTSFFSWGIPYNLSMIPAILFPLSVAHGLLKYSLFDLDIVVKVGLTRGALAGALLLIYALLVSLLGVGTGVYEQEPLVPIFFSILVVLVFNPLLRWIEGAVDRYVYRKEYDPAELQSEASLLLRSLSRPQVVAERCVKLLADRMAIESACMCFWPAASTASILAVHSLEDDDAREALGRLHRLRSGGFGVDRKVLSKGGSISEPFDRELRGELAGIFDELKSELLIPIIFHQEVVGLISLGRKRSGRDYDGDDFRLLSTLADQLALAFENGRLFEESERAKESYEKLYDESQALNQRLIEVDELKKQFVANISHELRTPVSTILGYAEVLLDPSFAGDRRPILERVAGHGQDLSQLMDNLMEFSRMESGSLGLALKEVNVREIFQALETMARRLIKERPIEFRADIESHVESIETDPKKLQQVLTHFLTNALKFTERGEIALGIRPLLEKGEMLVELWVSDTGIGISQRDQEVIFEDFRQLDGSSSRQYGGTGVGLSLCKKLAQSLGGRIEVRSEAGKGSAFSLIVPAHGAQRQIEAGLAEVA